MLYIGSHVVLLVSLSVLCCNPSTDILLHSVSGESSISLNLYNSLYLGDPKCMSCGSYLCI